MEKKMKPYPLTGDQKKAIRNLTTPAVIDIVYDCDTRNSERAYNYRPTNAVIYAPQSGVTVIAMSDLIALAYQRDAQAAATYRSLHRAAQQLLQLVATHRVDGFAERTLAGIRLSGGLSNGE